MGKLKKIKKITSLFADIATIIGCAFAVKGVCVGIKFVVDVKPIIEKNFIHSTDTVKGSKDTVVIIYKDTVYALKPVSGNNPDLSFEEYVEKEKKDFEDYVNKQKEDFKKFVDKDKTDFEDYVKQQKKDFKESADKDTANFESFKREYEKKLKNFETDSDKVN
jgi:hypothetical protein